MPFNVLFRGLVCHFTNNMLSVFIDAPGHDLRLVARTADIVGTPSIERDPGRVHTEGAGEESFLIKKRVLSLSGVPATTLTRDQNFRRHVPSLRNHSTCNTVRPSILQRKFVTQIGAYFRMPGGAFSVKQFFPNQATFNGSGAAECIARVVQLAVPTNGQNVTLRAGNQRMTLKPTAEIRIVNVAPPTPVATFNHHFHHYYHAIYTGCGMGDTPEHVLAPCPNSSSPIDPGADCSNSQEP